MAFVGVGLSLYVGWILALVMLAYIPLVMCAWSNNVATKAKAAEEED